MKHKLLIYSISLARHAKPGSFFWGVVRAEGMKSGGRRAILLVGEGGWSFFSLACFAHSGLLLFLRSFVWWWWIDGLLWVCVWERRVCWLFFCPDEGRFEVWRRSLASKGDKCCFNVWGFLSVLLLLSRTRWSLLAFGFIFSLERSSKKVLEFALRFGRFWDWSRDVLGTSISWMLNKL